MPVSCRLRACARRPSINDPTAGELSKHTGRWRDRSKPQDFAREVGGRQRVAKLATAGRTRACTTPLCQSCVCRKTRADPGTHCALRSESNLQSGKAVSCAVPSNASTGVPPSANYTSNLEAHASESIPLTNGRVTRNTHSDQRWSAL